MGAAMLFNNLSLDIFGCELKPNEAVSDEYAFCSGGSGQKDVDLSTAPDLAEQSMVLMVALMFLQHLAIQVMHNQLEEEEENNEDLNNEKLS